MRRIEGKAAEIDGSQEDVKRQDGVHAEQVTPQHPIETLQQDVDLTLCRDALQRVSTCGQRQCFSPYPDLGVFSL